jgi:hypothetical protein
MNEDQRKALLTALERQRREHEADPAKAREFLMGLGYWNEDGSLKDEAIPPDAEHPVNYRRAFRS